MNWQRKLELNSLSPYNVENDEHGLVYTFTTEFGVAYSVSFLIPGDLYAEFTPWGKQVYDFSFVPNQTESI